MELITLVVTMVIAGHDAGRHEKMASRDACWTEARRVMEELLKPADDRPAITMIGIGCVVEKGEPL